MRTLVLATAAVATLIPLTSATGATLTLGGPLAQLCYQSAKAADGRAAAYDGCTRALQEESLATPDRAATLVNRGIVLMNGGRATAADADFDAALQLQANLPDGWLNKAFVRLRQGNGREALPLIQKAMEVGSTNQALSLFARGVAYEQMGEFGSAYADLKRARQLAPDWALPREYLASYSTRSR